MSFGFGVQDFVAAGTLAYKVWSECKAASDDYKELGTLCWEIGVVVDNCRPLDPNSVLKKQHVETIARLAANCKATLSDLEALLHNFQNMGGIQGIGRRFGFITSKAEREDIRSRLREHLGTINTFLSGVQLDTMNLTVRLLFKVLEGQYGSIKPDAVREIVDDPDLLEELFKEVRSENAALNTDLEKDKDAIREKLKKTADEKNNPSLKRNSESVSSESSKTAVTSPSIKADSSFGPAKPSSDPYDPWSISWFKDGGYRFLTAVTAASFTGFVPHEPLMKYSKHDDWLSVYPEGWSMIRTMTSRNFKKEEAIYFTFNNLSSLPGNKPRTTRAYFLNNPFSYDGMSLEPIYLGVEGVDSLSALGQPKSKFQMFTNIPGGLGQIQKCIGFHYNWIPFDLGDELSNQLAMMQIGAHGKQSVYTDRTIKSSLPKYWIWQRWIDSEGTQRNVYLDTQTKTESTVHPARFYNSDEDVSHVLPPGWERRLDSWGNLFFVDHHTQRAVREDPRFTNATDQRTGLPQGWSEIEDHQGNSYFYTEMGSMVFGTTEPAAMTAESQQDWNPLSRVPVKGDNVSSLVEITTPLTLRIAAAKRKKEEAQAAITTQNTNPPMTEMEEIRYHEIFDGITKADRFRLSQTEALEHCKTFRLRPRVIQNILGETDSNKDLRWNVNEYADALHMIHFELKKSLAKRPLRPRTTEDNLKYEQLFDSVRLPNTQLITQKEVMKACKPLQLPSEFIQRIFVRADANRDKKWSIDEFAGAMHRVMHEVETRDELRKIEPVQLTGTVRPNTDAESIVSPTEEYPRVISTHQGMNGSQVSTDQSQTENKSRVLGTANDLATEASGGAPELPITQETSDILPYPAVTYLNDAGEKPVSGSNESCPIANVPTNEAQLPGPGPQPKNSSGLITDSEQGQYAPENGSKDDPSEKEHERSVDNVDHLEKGRTPVD